MKIKQRKGKIRVGDIVFNDAIYPRGRIDDVHVRNLADALLAGKELPPIVVRASDNATIEGWHRTNAIIRVYGADHEVDVLFIDGLNDAKALELSAD